ncbi:MAG TPA: putative lipid II flippase FtsW [Thauera sp.]|nr:putative lipid II flippase FtsW [Thauera sp.]
MKLGASLTALFSGAARKADTRSRVADRIARGSVPGRELDPLLIWSAIGLLLLGLVMVYSASIAIAEGSRFTGYQPYYFVTRHALFLTIGIGCGLLAFKLPMAHWQQMAPWLFVGGVVLLVAVLIPGLGREVNGAQRWLSVGLINLQPSELMKIFAVLYAADYTVRKLDAMSSFRRGFLPMTVVIIMVGGLLLREPDFGAFVVITTIAFGVLFLGGVNGRVFVLLAVVAVIGFIILILSSPYRLERVLGFMDPWKDAFRTGYQLSHALIAFGRGEWFGVGLGGSVEKLFYLPEAHTDFLLAVIAEELGFVGVMVVVLMFAVLVQRAFVIGREAIKLERYFVGLVAQGIGLWIGVQSFINMGVNMGLLPTKGLTLPLMSFGGSGIVANCVALAILLRCDWEVRQLKRGSSV